MAGPPVTLTACAAASWTMSAQETCPAAAVFSRPARTATTFLGNALTDQPTPMSDRRSKFPCYASRLALRISLFTVRYMKDCMPAGWND